MRAARPCRMLAALLGVTAFAVVAFGQAPPQRDEIRVTLYGAAEGETGLPVSPEGESGRLLVFLLRDGARTGPAEPRDAPFFRDPQPLFGIDVTGWKAGETRTVDARTLGWPVSLDRLEGGFRLQAVLKRDLEGRGHAGPGNPYGGVVLAEFTAEGSEVVDLSIDRVDTPPVLPELPRLRWIEFRSESLSKALGREVVHRAGVAFPPGYDDLAAPRRHWPTVYVIPAFGGSHLDAERYARLLASPRARQALPQAVHVVLDPNTPLGHHGFADGDRHGPRATALVEEFIPHLEGRFRLVAKPEARVVTGHSSGGWSSLWLQLSHPETFGACFASAPDPVEFTAFQTIDLYRDGNLFSDDEGRERPSYREPLGPVEDRVRMTVREELGVEHVLSPTGASGEQWGAWDACFSGRDPRTGRPARAWDPETGAIDRTVIERDWSRYDLGRTIEREWQRLGPILAGRVRLLCGDRDSFYLEGAVRRLRDRIDGLRRADAARGIAPAAGPGYIELVPEGTHDTVAATAALRWAGEMRDHFRRHGLGD